MHWWNASDAFFAERGLDMSDPRTREKDYIAYGVSRTRLQTSKRLVLSVRVVGTKIVRELTGRGIPPQRGVSSTIASKLGTQ